MLLITDCYFLTKLNLKILPLYTCFAKNVVMYLNAKT